MENREISEPGAGFVDGLILGDHLKSGATWRAGKADEDDEEERNTVCPTGGRVTCGDEDEEEGNTVCPTGGRVTCGDAGDDEDDEERNTVCPTGGRVTCGDAGDDDDDDDDY